MRMLVTGASGFVGSLLTHRLLDDGHEVRAGGRLAGRVSAALAGPRADREAEVVELDVITGAGLDGALEGIDVAYYLVHSMEHAAAGSSDFATRERIGAENFARAACRAGVDRVVYLGGLLPQPSPGHSSPSRHLASRRAVEEILLDQLDDAIALRASIVVGARSRSFRLLVHLVERMPVIALPAWQRFRTQPIDARDVVSMLAACARARGLPRAMDIAGPDVLTYGERLETIADLMLVRRPALRIGVSLNAIAPRVAAAIAGEDPELVLPLMEGLHADLLAADDHAAELLNVRLHTYRAAVEHSLREWESTERLAAR